MTDINWSQFVQTSSVIDFLIAFDEIITGFFSKALKVLVPHSKLFNWSGKEYGHVLCQKRCEISAVYIATLADKTKHHHKTVI